MQVDDPDLEIDVQGVPMPWWLMSRPDQVVHIAWSDETVKTCTTFEHLFGQGMVYHCTYPRHASNLTQPDPQRECGWTCPEYDEAAFIEHSRTHLGR